MSYQRPENFVETIGNVTQPQAERLSDKKPSPSSTLMRSHSRHPSIKFKNIEQIIYMKFVQNNLHDPLTSKMKNDTWSKDQ